MSPVERAMRWAFQVAWIASFLWLAGCLTDVLGWRGAGSVFIAWSVPSLPLFVATAEWRARHDAAGTAPWMPAIVAAWAGAIWWAGATPAVPHSPAAFALATIAVLVAAIGVLFVQGDLLHIPRAQVPAPGIFRRRARRVAAVAAHSGAR